MAKDNKTWLIVAAIAVVAYFLIPGVQTTINGFFSGQPVTPVTPTPGTPATGECLKVDDTSITLSAIERDNPSVTGGNMNYFLVYVNGAMSSDTDGAFVASPGDRVVVYVAANATAGAVDYYTLKDEFTVPCSGTLSKEYNVPAKATATIAFYNEDGDKIVGTSSGTFQDVDQDETISSVKMKIGGVYEDYFSPFGPMVAVWKYYQTHFDDIKVTSCDSGRTVKAVAVPKNITSTTSYEFSAFEIGPTGTMSSEEIVCSLLLDAGSVNPTGSTANATVTLMDSNYFRAASSNEMKIGVEDDNGGGVGAADISADLVFVAD